MDTSRMLRFEELNAHKVFALYTKSEQLKEIAAEFYEAMDKTLIRNQIVEIVEANYDLGKVIDVYEIFGGYINRSFGIYTVKDGQRYEYFVRKYKKDITEKEIKFEHSLINFAIANGLDIAAGVIPARDGKTYVKTVEGTDGNERDQYFAVYEFLHGEDKYTWDNPTCTDEEYASSAEVLATFHNAARNFDPQGLERIEPKIMELLPTLPELYKKFATRDLSTKFHKYYLKSLDSILEVIDRTRIPEEDLAKMIYNPIHCDYHPGNLKYANNKAVGIFDFDWSKIDLRLFDVCLALAYFCSSWEDQLDGTLLLDKCAIFLKAYQNRLKELGGLAPLTELELKHMPTMLAAANLYLINWDVTAYYAGTDLNDYEYLAYLQHNVRLMRWIEDHKPEIAEMAKTI